MEPDFYAMVPNNITVHSARMMLQDVTPKSLELMMDESLSALKLLNTASVDVVVYGCTSGSLIKGVKWETNLVDKLKQITNIPVLTTAGAVVEALKLLEVKKVTVITPYIEKINRMEKRFLEAYGINIVKIKGLGITNNLKIGKTKVSEVQKHIQLSPETDCLFISCTNLPVINLIQKLEEKFKIPVVTSNQASLWKSLKILDQNGINNFGTLLKNY
jgi:maleate isomerase